MKPIGPTLDSRHAKSTGLTLVKLLRCLKPSTYLNTSHHQPWHLPNGDSIFSSRFKGNGIRVTASELFFAIPIDAYLGLYPLSIASLQIPTAGNMVPVQYIFTDFFFLECHH